MKGTINKYIVEVPSLGWKLKSGGIFSAISLTIKFWWFLITRRLFYVNKKMCFAISFNGNRFCTNIYNNSDFLTFRTTYLIQDYFIAELKEPNLIIDAGANVGFVAQYFRALYPRSKIICLEPIKSNFAKLEENVGCDSNIILLNKALGETDTSAVFSVSDQHSFSASYRSRKNSLDKEVVEVISLKSFFSMFNISKIDLFKYDVEGAEDQIFFNSQEIRVSENYAGEVHGDLMDVPVNEFLLRFSKYSLKTRPLGQNRLIVKATSNANKS